jgi:hypothetical protein
MKTQKKYIFAICWRNFAGRLLKPVNRPFDLFTDLREIDGLVVADGVQHHCGGRHAVCHENRWLLAKSKQPST